MSVKRDGSFTNDQKSRSAAQDSGCCGGARSAHPPIDTPAAQPCCEGASRFINACCSGNNAAGSASANTSSAPADAVRSDSGVSLTSLQPGQTAVVCDASMDEREASLLRAMGLKPNCIVRMCRVGEPCIVEVMYACQKGGQCTCRIGLAKPLAAQVRVGDVRDE